jgi:hypothetical protein
MSKPAAFLGVYTDLKFLSGLKVARVTLEIPIERSQEFIGMFGTPNKADPAWCAIARMDVEALKAPTVPEKPAEPAPVEKAKAKRSNLAAIMCKENEAFQVWLAEKYPKVWDRFYYHEIGGSDASPAAANDTLKTVLGIASKKELDTDPEAAARFDALRTDFELRDMVR